MSADMMYQPDLWEMYGQCCGTGRRLFEENHSISVADRLPGTVWRTSGTVRETPFRVGTVLYLFVEKVFNL